jgi:hypothetical protein
MTRCSATATICLEPDESIDPNVTLYVVNYDLRLRPGFGIFVP